MAWLAAQTIALSLKTQIDSVIGFVQQLPTFEAEVLRLEDVLEQERDPLLRNEESDSIDSNGRLSGEIVLKNVSFGFVAIKDPLISNLSLTIHPGQRIALVGGMATARAHWPNSLRDFTNPLMEKFSSMDRPGGDTSCDQHQFTGDGSAGHSDLRLLCPRKPRPVGLIHQCIGSPAGL